MNMLVAINAINKTPVFADESHEERVVRLSSNTDGIKILAKKRRDKILRIVKESPFKYNIQVLADKLQVTTCTIRSDITKISEVTKSKEVGLKNKYIYIGA